MQPAVQTDVMRVVCLAGQKDFYWAARLAVWSEISRADWMVLRPVGAKAVHWVFWWAVLSAVSWDRSMVVTLDCAKAGSSVE